jgi:hypothetical protein
MCAFVATLDEATTPAPFSPPRTKNKNKQQQRATEPSKDSFKGLPLDIPPPVTPDVSLLHESLRDCKIVTPQDLFSSLSMFCPDDHVSSKGKSRW